MPQTQQQSQSLSGSASRPIELASAADASPYDRLGPFPGSEPGAGGAEPVKRGRGRPKGAKTGGGSAAGGGGGGSGGGAVSAAQLAEILCTVFGFASVLLALWLVGGDEEAQAAIALQPEEAQAIAAPTARILSKTKMARRYAKAITNSSDYLALSLALFAYFTRITPAIVTKLSQRSPRRAAPKPAQPLPTAEPPSGPSANGHAPYAAYGNPLGPGYIPS